MTPLHLLAGNGALLAPREYQDSDKDEQWKATSKSDSTDPKRSSIAVNTDVSGSKVSEHSFREGGVTGGTRWKGAGTEPATDQLAVDATGPIGNPLSGALAWTHVY